jgi:microcystin-dependent protein
MYETLVGSVMTIAFEFVPDNFLLCNGQMVSTSQYKYLYSLIGNYYGGDTAHFAVPDLRPVDAAGNKRDWIRGETRQIISYYGPLPEYP